MIVITEATAEEIKCNNNVSSTFLIRPFNENVIESIKWIMMSALFIKLRKQATTKDVFW